MTTRLPRCLLAAHSTSARSLTLRAVTPSIVLPPSTACAADVYQGSGCQEFEPSVPGVCWRGVLWIARPRMALHYGVALAHTQVFGCHRPGTRRGSSSVPPKPSSRLEKPGERSAME